MSKKTYPIRKIFQHLELFTKPTVLSYLHGLNLQPVQDNTDSAKKSDLLLFCTLRNEVIRIPYFLDYYRKMGVKHFFFVDNGSTDNFRKLLANETDCSIWYTSASYKWSNFGMHWLNYLLRKYGTGHWCITVDPDEFITFPYQESRSMGELIEFLESTNRESFFCLLLDMYSKTNVSLTHYTSGQNPLDAAAYFDKTGYIQSKGQYGDTWIQGGPRLRMMFKNDPLNAPAVNKTPLVKWQRSYNYLSSMHMLAPKRLNRAHSLKSPHLSPTGCLLHFKFLSTLSEKAQEEIARKEHYAGSREYKQYDKFIQDKSDILYYSHSEKYTDTNQLIKLNLMNIGSWF